MGVRRAGGSVVALVAGALLAACVAHDAAGPPAAAPAATVEPASVTTVPPPAPTTTVPAPPTATTVPAVEPPRPSSLPAGVHEQQVEVDGQIRRWITVVPPGAEGAAPAPLVVVLHGVGGRGADMRSTGFEPLAASQRVIVAYPDALGGAWNDGRPGADPVVPGMVPDDTRFLRLLVEETAARTGADTGRVAVVGFSNGAVMAGRVACDLADRVSVVALVAGTAGQGFEQSCRPARPVAVMVVAGSNDRIVPYAGGRVPDWNARRRGFVAGVDDFFAFWRNQSGCSATQAVPGSAQVSVVRGVDCKAGAPVFRYRVATSVHEWFRPPAFDTTNTVWDFLTRRFSPAA